MKTQVLFLSLCVFVLTPSLLADEGHQHQHEAGEQLGTVSFPVSCAPAVQKPFERGVALLHSFWYEEAQKQFLDVAARDPHCAMAHWGVALSLYHQLWERPQEAQLKRGWEEAQAAEKIGAKTARERGYIAAIAAFYDPAEKDHLARAKAYSQAMEKVYRENPGDIEAAAFYALSLLASQDPDDETLANKRQAVAILNPLFLKDPGHPGLAHYIIHACDNPQMAPLALDAARRYAEIAPSSPHAVHMPSHIFARLGLWQEDIQSNLRSVAVTHSADAMHMGGSGHQLHAMHFLIYAYLQTGNDAAAKKLVDDSRAIIARLKAQPDDGTGMTRYYDYALAHFPALYDLETRDWAAAAALEPVPGAKPIYRSITYQARTIATAHLGDVEATRRNAQQFDQLIEETKKGKDAYMVQGRNPEADEVHAWLAFAEKKNDDALRLVRSAADYEDKVGKAEVAIPAREMLADMLLEMNRPEEALAEYRKALKSDPNRFNSLYGAARAAELAHQPAAAETYYAQLLKNCSGDSDRPELSRAKTAIAKAGQ